MKKLIIILLICQICTGCENVDEKSVPSLIKEAESSIVRVMFVTKDKEKVPLPVVRGSAFLVAPGIAVTALHVIDGLPEKSIFLVPADQNQLNKKNLATIFVKDPNHDLVLLRCPFLKDRSFLKLGEPNQVEIGEESILMGFPMGDPILTSSKAMIAAKARIELLKGYDVLTDMFKLDCAINSGNSGGPVIHIPSGKVIGVVSLKVGAISQKLQIFKKKKARSARITLEGDDPIDLLQETLKDMERNLNLGLGYAISVSHLKKILEMSTTQMQALPE